MANLWMDTHARRVGDTLTVTINEINSATNTEQRTLKKDTAASGKFDFSAATGNAASATAKAANATISADNSSDRSFQGTANFQTNRQLSDAMQVRVVDIHPNGNLVIQGVRVVTFSGETQYVVLHGIIRPDDIARDNSIVSTNIADARVEFYAEGALTDAQKRGWLSKVYEKLRPF